MVNRLLTIYRVRVREVNQHKWTPGQVTMNHLWHLHYMTKSVNTVIFCFFFPINSFSPVLESVFLICSAWRTECSNVTVYSKRPITVEHTLSDWRLAMPPMIVCRCVTIFTVMNIIHSLVAGVERHCCSCTYCDKPTRCSCSQSRYCFQWRLSVCACVSVCLSA